MARKLPIPSITKNQTVLRPRHFLFEIEGQLTFYQKEISALTKPVVMVISSTKAGKTYLMLRKATEALLGGNKNKIYWVAPTYRVARTAFNRLLADIYKVPAAHRAQLFSINITRNEVCFLLTGATIEFKSAENPDTLYSEDVNLVIIDEFPRCKEEAFFALRSVLTKTRGNMFLIGNMSHPQNWGVKMFADRSNEDFIDKYTVTCDQAVSAGILAAEFVALQEKILPKHIFLRDYKAVYAAPDNDRWFAEFFEHKHVVPSIELDHGAPVYISIDFNFNNFVCIFFQTDLENYLHIFFCIKIEKKGSFEELLRQTNIQLPDIDPSALYATGDATGTSSNVAFQRGAQSAWARFINVFNLNKRRVLLGAYNPKYLNSNPSHENSFESVNTLLRDPSFDFKIAANCTPVISDLQIAQINYGTGSSAYELKKDATKLNMNAADCVRYALHLVALRPRNGSKALLKPPRQSLGGGGASAIGVITR